MSVCVWADGSLTEVPKDDEPRGEVIASDSWLVLNGRVRALKRHRARFFAAVGGKDQAPEGAPDQAPALAPFWSAVEAALPRQGEFFPKVEALRTRGGVVLTFALRPAPPRTDHVRVWAPGIVDPRSAPRTKGPDLAGLVALRQQGRDHGCDETLLQAPDGSVVEAANSSLMWWEGDTFCIPDRLLPALAGVTVGLILEEVRRRGIEIRECRAKPSVLVGNEVWLTSALQGIRPVSSWVLANGVEAPAAATARAAAWRQWLLEAARPLPSCA
ncbi:MAG: aminotransferase class IV [Galactobacter sp.]